MPPTPGIHGSLSHFMGINWRASLLPAATIVSIAYIRVVAVKKLAGGFLLRMTCPTFGCIFGSAVTFLQECICTC